MRHIPKIQPNNFLAFTSELLGKSRIIKFPEDAEYNFQDTLNVLLHAATSPTNSIESASEYLRAKTPNSNVPSGDSVHGYIKSNTVDYILSSFGKITEEIVQLTNLKGTYQDAAIDFHDEPYYGDKNTPGIRGIKPKNGTSWGHSFCTVDIIGDTKLTLDIVKIHGLEKNYSILIESILDRVRTMKITIKTLLMDKEFFNSAVISTLHKSNINCINYIIAAKSNKKINTILLEHKKKFGETSTVFEYQFNDNGPKFNIVAIRNPKYNPDEKKDKGNHEYHLFATNIPVTIATDILKKIPEEYRKRWNIETGYRLKNAYKIRTCSKSPVVRTLIFVIQCILYNIESLLKQVIVIDAYKLKSAISDAILSIIIDGYESLIALPLRDFMNSLRKYNEDRTAELREGLRIT